MKTSIEKIKVLNRQGELKNGVQIKIISDIDAPIDVFWERLQNVSSLVEICKPLVYFKAYSCDLPTKWEILKTYQFKLSLYKFSPALKHTICLTTVDKSSYEIESQEYNRVVTVWNHVIKMKSIDQNKTSYQDIVDIYAGCLTPIVARWAVYFYKHRQRKWVRAFFV